MELTTARLVLREFRGDDWPAVLAYQSEPLYLRYTPWTERTPEAVRAFVETFIAQQRESPRTRTQLAVTLRCTGALIGNAGIRLMSPPTPEMAVHAANIGYELDPGHWGRGYATEAAGALLAHGFGELGLHRIEAYAVAENSASIHVLEKLGLRREGHLRDNAFFRGRWWDTLVYAILEHEWRGEAGQGDR